jgi:deferrochelatase/peroxidase EfeB
LFFIASQRDPVTGFVQVQRDLRTDAMNEYIRHTSSAVFACPPPGDDDLQVTMNGGAGVFGD